MKVWKSTVNLAALLIVFSACEKPSGELATDGATPNTLTAFRNDAGKWGYKKNGKEVIPAKFDGVIPFRDGTARIKEGELYGFINEKGEYIIEPQYADATRFSEGLAAVKKEDKWGFIDQKGEFVIEPTYGSADIFSEGFASVELDGKMGYIDKDNNFKEGDPPGTADESAMTDEEAAADAADDGR